MTPNNYYPPLDFTPTTSPSRVPASRYISRWKETMNIVKVW